MRQAYRANFLNGELKNLRPSSKKWRRKNFVLRKYWSIRIKIYIFWYISSSLTRIYLSWSKKIFSSRLKFVIETCPLPQTSRIWGKNLHRFHNFGNGHERFEALKDQSCVVWWRRWYFWTRHYLRTKNLHIPSSFSLWYIAIFSKVDQLKIPLYMA